MMMNLAGKAWSLGFGNLLDGAPHPCQAMYGHVNGPIGSCVSVSSHSVPLNRVLALSNDPAEGVPSDNGQLFTAQLSSQLLICIDELGVLVVA